jgi:hypothetical protein
MRLFLLTIFSGAFLTTAVGQVIYTNHQGGRAVQYFGQYNGILDSTALNPKPDEINSNETCIKYRRSKEEIYDNIKIQLKGKLSNVVSYATYEGNPPKISMKIYSTAPVGTQIEIQLGKKSEVAYPDGVHSQYQAVTKKQNQWEVVEFLFAQRPEGSKVSDNEVDQLTLLFAPKTETNYIFYYDELKGPELINTQQ